jgi:hypothetical protein
MTDKEITGWVVVDWKTGDLKIRKTKPKASELGTNELRTKVKFDVSVPEVDVPTLAAEVNVPEPRVYAATLDAIDDEDLPEWADVAIEKVDDHRVAFEEAANAPEFDAAVDQATVATLQDTPGRPDVEAVREFVRRTATDLDDDGVAPVSDSG